MAGRCGLRGTVAWLLIATLVIEVLKRGGERWDGGAGAVSGVREREPFSLHRQHHSVDTHEGLRVVPARHERRNAAFGLDGRVASGASKTVPSADTTSPKEDAPRYGTAGGDNVKGTCAGEAHLELAGDVVVWGADHKVADAVACCERCRSKDGCNVWVFCGDAEGCGAKVGQCWLKRQTLYEGLPPGAMSRGDGTPWMSGHLPRYSDPKDDPTGGVDVEMRKVDIALVESTPPARPRECGSPAVDGYSHVVPDCLVKSRTNVEFDRSEAARSEQVAWYEEHASYDGLAVAWGIGHRKPTAAACAAACRAHKPGPPHHGPFADLPCNAWVWCPVMETKGCFEPDAHTHGPGDCWLKFTETPENVEVNQRGANDAPGTVKDGATYRKRHPDAPRLAHWTSGVMLPPGWTPSNGTYGPRATW